MAGLLFSEFLDVDLCICRENTFLYLPVLSVPRRRDDGFVVDKVLSLGEQLVGKRTRRNSAAVCGPNDLFL